MELNGVLSGVSSGAAGRLGITSNEIVIGPSAPRAADATGLAPLMLSTGLFATSGFRQFDLTANANGITVAAGARVEPVTVTRVFDEAALARRTGEDIEGFSHVERLPPEQRTPAGISLTLARSVPVNNPAAAIRVESGALIRTDPRGTVGLTSDTSIFLDGQIRTPGGAIDLQLTPPITNDQGFSASQGIWLGAGSRLDAAGVYVPELNPYGLRRGEVLPGGSIRLRADRGYILGRAAARDVSGAAPCHLPGMSGAARGVITAQTTGSHAGGTVAAEGILSMPRWARGRPRGPVVAD
jgi:hypothetical protein